MQMCCRLGVGLGFERGTRSCICCQHQSCTAVTVMQVLLSSGIQEQLHDLSMTGTHCTHHGCTAQIITCVHFGASFQQQPHDWSMIVACRRHQGCKVVAVAQVRVSAGCQEQLNDLSMTLICCISSPELWPPGAIQ